jgi:NADP-dependent 3-hydroxy acid dehydrogenase YdfG
MGRMTIAGKVIALTGASSGIGEATALLLAEQGAKLVLGARREDLLTKLTDRITGAGGEAVYLVTDVTRRACPAALVALAGERFGRLDVLISNAGVARVAPLDDLDVDSWDEMIDVNLKGVVYGIAAALPVFRAQGSGHFVTTSSTAAYKTVPGMAVYSASKTALRALLDGLRQEAGEKLRVTTVTPGYVATEFGAKSFGGSPEALRRLQELAPAGIPPESVARAVAYAIDQPADVDLNEIVIRPTAQA